MNASKPNDSDVGGFHTRKRINHPKQDKTNGNVEGHEWLHSQKFEIKIVSPSTTVKSLMLNWFSRLLFFDFFQSFSSFEQPFQTRSLRLWAMHLWQETTPLRLRIGGRVGKDCVDLSNSETSSLRGKTWLQGKISPGINRNLLQPISISSQLLANQFNLCWIQQCNHFNQDIPRATRQIPRLIRATRKELRHVP